jgi:hypothetical protein
LTVSYSFQLVRLGVAWRANPSGTPPNRREMGRQILSAAADDLTVVASVVAAYVLIGRITGSARDLEAIFGFPVPNWRGNAGTEVVPGGVSRRETPTVSHLRPR